MKKIYRALCLGVSVLCTAMSATGADYYWVGNGGNWSDFSNHWATTSGGSLFHSIVPTSLDNVVFDVNSFLIPGQTVNIDQTVVQCKDMTWTGVTNTPTLSLPSINAMRVFGSLTFAAGMNTNLQGPVSFEAASGGKTITSPAKTFYYVTFDGIGGSWTLQDAISVSDHCIMKNGTLNSNDKTVQAQYFEMTGAAPALNMGASVFNILGQWLADSPGLSLNAGTSTINMTGAAGYAVFYGGGRNYYNLNFTSTTLTGHLYRNNNIFNGNVIFFGPGMILDDGNSFNQNCTFLKNGSVVGGSHTYNTLTLTPGFTYSFFANSIQTITGSIVANGNCGALINLSSLSNGVAATISKTTGSVTLSYVTLKDITATGGATFTANNAINFGNSAGWTVNQLPSKNLYWVGNGGNWNDGNHWSLSSGGPASGCSPTAVDNVIFNATSFTSSGQTVTINSPTGFFNDMTWTGVTNTPTLSLPSINEMRVFGSLTFAAGMNANLQGPVSFEAASGGKTITSAAKTFYQLTFDGIGGNWTLQDAITSDVIKINNGTLNSNDKTVQASFVYMNGPAPGLNMGSSIFNIVSAWFTNSTGLSLNAGTSTINITGSGSNADFYGGGHSYYNVNFTSPTITSTLRSSNNLFNGIVKFFGPGMILEGGNSFNQSCIFLKNGRVVDNETYNILELTPGFTYTFEANKTQTIQPAGSIIAQGTPGFPIRIQSSIGGTPATTFKAAGSICLDYVRMSDNTATGGATFNAGSSPTRSLDMAGNSGWLFTGGCVLLPVSMLEFTATKDANNVVSLQWKTASEINTDHFVIQKSTDAINYISIGEKTAAGNSAAIKSYSFIDAQPANGTIFYRLKSVDIDAKYSYSKIVALHINSTSIIELFPNPAKETIYVQLNGKYMETVTVRISDAAGKSLHKEKVSLSGVTSFSIGIESLPKGIYYLQVTGQSIHLQQKFIKL